LLGFGLFSLSDKLRISALDAFAAALMEETAPTATNNKSPIRNIGPSAEMKRAVGSNARTSSTASGFSRAAPHP